MKIFLILLFSISLLSACSNAEQEFNDSGRAKAILDESDLFKYSDEQLQGKWISNDDEISSIEFIDGMKIDYYDNEKVSEGIYTLLDQGLIVTADGEDFEYSIVDLSDSQLVLNYLSRGNTLVYKKH